MLVNVLTWGSGINIEGGGYRPLFPGMIAWERKDKKPEPRKRETLYFKLVDMDEQELLKQIEKEEKLYKNNKEAMKSLLDNGYRQQAIHKLNIKGVTLQEEKSEKKEDDKKEYKSEEISYTQYNRLKKSELTKLLEKNKIKYNKEANKKEIVKLCYNKQLEV